MPASRPRVAPTTGRIPGVRGEGQENRQQNRLRNRLNKSALLASQRCIDCDEADPAVLEFDHRDPKLKSASVSRMAARNTWSTVLVEIAKSETRCVNCHRRRTANQIRWTKLGLRAAGLE